MRRGDRLTSLKQQRLGLVGLLIVATTVRALHLTTWSLWFDEGTAIYHALNSQQAFPLTCPLYFRALSGIYQFGGDYVFWGRVLSALFGTISVWLLFEFCRRNISTRVAFIAGLLLALNLYHLFWSQSIRYYTMLLAAQMAASLFFVEGVVHRNRAKLMAAGAISMASIWIHSSAVFLIPVWVGHLGILRLLRRTDDKTVAWATVLSIVPFVGSMLWALPAIRALQAAGAFGPIEPLVVSGLLVRILFYFGPPLVLLALASATFRRHVPIDAFVYIGLLATLPILEICVVGVLGLGNVTMHHAFVAIAGVVALAAVSINGLAESRHPRLAAGVSAATFAYVIAMLWQYFTIMHGDRSRWAEATELLKQHVTVSSASRTPVYSTEPNIVAGYLGVPASETLGSELVTRVRSTTVSVPAYAGVRWYLVDARIASSELQSWLNTHAERIGTFEARTWPRDRTVTVYRVDGDGALSTRP